MLVRAAPSRHGGAQLVLQVLSSVPRLTGDIFNNGKQNIFEIVSRSSKSLS